MKCVDKMTEWERAKLAAVSRKFRPTPAQRVEIAKLKSLRSKLTMTPRHTERTAS